MLNRDENPVVIALRIMNFSYDEGTAFGVLAELYWKAYTNKLHLLLPTEIHRMSLSAIRSQKGGEVNLDLRMWAEHIYAEEFLS